MMTAAEFETVLTSATLPVLRTAEIPVDAIEIVESRVNRLRNRADKKGFPKPTLLVGPTFTETVRNRGTEGCIRSGADDLCLVCGKEWEIAHYRTVEYAKVAVVASAKMAVAGWHLVAVIAPVVKDGKTIGVATTVPGEVALTSLVTDDWDRCDHCQTRRRRSETFVVQNEAGEQRQIGRQCLRDFLGHDPTSLIGWLNATESLIGDDDLESWGSAAPRMYRPDEVIDLAAQVVANTGYYISRQKAEYENRVATGAAIWEMLAPTAQSVEDFHKDYPLPGTALAEATKRANLLLVESDEANNDWLRNVAAVVGLDWVQRRHVGIVASSVILGQRLMEREAKEKVAAVLKAERDANGSREPGHIGTIGERMTTDLIVEFSKTFDGQYGVTTLIKFRTAEGDLVQWWASGEWDLETGETVTLTGTVKSHEMDRHSNEPVTTLTRCRVAPVAA